MKHRVSIDKIQLDVEVSPPATSKNHCQEGYGLFEMSNLLLQVMLDKDQVKGATGNCHADGQTESDAYTEPTLT